MTSRIHPELISAMLGKWNWDIATGNVSVLLSSVVVGLQCLGWGPSPPACWVHVHPLSCTQPRYTPVLLGVSSIWHVQFIYINTLELWEWLCWPLLYNCEVVGHRVLTASHGRNHRKGTPQNTSFTLNVIHHFFLNPSSGKMEAHSILFINKVFTCQLVKHRTQFPKTAML